jgi:DNA end-binding protein Ku
MPRAVWKGAISFGLVHLPVSLFPATQDSGVDFQWLDRRSLDPVGYKRYNKRTGRELKMQDIVKGVRQPNGKYVVLTDEEIRAAFPKSTQIIQIESFVKRSELPFMMLERPYYIQPAGKSEKVYVLLREAMREADVVALARLVIHNKEHLAAIVISEAALVLDVLRWAGDVRSAGQLGLPGKAGSAAGIKPEERRMASQLIQQMTGAWKPRAYAEHFTDAIGTLIRRKLAAGETHAVEPLEEAPAQLPTTNVVDLTELLAKSMRARRAAGAATTVAAGKTRTGAHRRRTTQRAPRRAAR